jgi:hypothetical protein
VTYLADGRHSSRVAKHQVAALRHVEALPGGKPHRRTWRGPRVSVRFSPGVSIE